MIAYNVRFTLIMDHEDGHHEEITAFARSFSAELKPYEDPALRSLVPGNDFRISSQEFDLSVEATYLSNLIIKRPPGRLPLGKVAP